MTSLFIGRYQPLHDGHIAIIRQVLGEGKDVCVAIRATPIGADNPYTYAQREQMFREQFPDEMRDGRMVVIRIPDVTEVCHGRAPGWAVREIEVSPEVAAISATKIRENECIHVPFVGTFAPTAEAEETMVLWDNQLERAKKMYEMRIQEIEDEMQRLKGERFVLESKSNEAKLKESAITVGDLVDYLSKFPQDALVFLENGEHNYTGMDNPKDAIYYANKSNVVVLRWALDDFYRRFVPVILESEI